MADHEACRVLFGTHNARAAETLGPLECGLDVGNSDVEDHVAVVASTADDAAGEVQILRVDHRADVYHPR